MASLLAAGNLNGYCVNVEPNHSMGGNGFISAVSANATGGSESSFTGVKDSGTPDATDDTANVGYFSFNGGRAATNLGGNMHQHVLGEVTVSQATVGNTTFLLSDCNVGIDGDFTDAAGVKFDDADNTNLTFTFNAAAVPEPSSFLFIGLLGTILSGLRWVRTRVLG